MPKSFRAITPGLRKLVLPNQDELCQGEKKAPKSLFEGKRRINGRNSNGRITCRHKGGGHKRCFRIIDFKRDKENIPATIASIDYDPNRSAFLALLNYKDGEKRYILAPQGVKIGTVVVTSNEAPFEFAIGNCMKLKHMPIGAIIHNIELHPGRGAQMVRSAGLSAQISGRSENYVSVKLPSGEVRLFNQECRATFGILSNAEHNLRVYGKAGRKRWIGIRPTVRGIAMNPVDHPMGGGEGRGKGHTPQSPTSVPAKGYRTRNPKVSRKWIVKERR
jgi:large subunit ribosomal protein L2